jgi:DNA helicase HerA-like ATPase
LKSRSAQSPVDLPDTGIVLGKNIYRNDEKLVRQKPNDRRLHTYIVGQTGTGKTTLLKNMIIQDIQEGKGVCFIDPHGDLANEILDFIPQERIKDVVYFNPADPKYTMSFNILESSPEKQMDQTFIINEVLEIMDKLYDLKISGGPIFEQYMRNSLALLMSDTVEQFTLVDVPAVLINDKFRSKLLSRTNNFLVKDF